MTDRSVISSLLIPVKTSPICCRANPYRVAVLQGRVVEIRPDEDGRYMDAIAVKYTSGPFPIRGPFGCV